MVRVTNMSILGAACAAVLVGSGIPAALAVPAVPPLPTQVPAQPVRPLLAEPQTPPKVTPLGISPKSATPVASNSFLDAIANGKVLFEARYRYEHVEQAGFARTADAHTVRVRAGYQTAKFWSLQSLVEFEGVGHLNNRFNDTVNGKAAYPVVADPEDVQVNRLQIVYDGLPGTVVTVGRQRINLDNQRFVGGVAFRQNEQTFDAVRVTNTSVPGFTLNYMFLNRVNRVFGEDSNQGSFNGATHLANASFNIADWGKLTGYAYFLELRPVPALSTRTLGARFAGEHAIDGAFKAVYALEYAKQSDNAKNPGHFDLDYWLAEGGVSAEGIKVLGGRESLGSDGVRGFSTPLATLHKFQGFADVFLTTPPNGIVDTYGALSYETKITNYGPWTGIFGAVTYHGFRASRGNASEGSETDAELVAKLGKHWQTGIKYADYNGDGPFADRKKVWVSIDMSY